MNDASPINARHYVHPVALVLGLWLIGLLVSLAVATWVDGNNAEAIDQQLIPRAEQLRAQLSARMSNYEKGVRGTRGAVLVGGMQHITPENFHIYMASRELEREFPGARGFGFIRRVAAADVGKFLNEVRRSIDSTFAIHQITPHDGERHVIELVEPLKRNQTARGLDIASELNRRTAALHAMHTGNATLTAPINFLENRTHPQRSFLLLLPVYQPGMSLDSIAQREAATVGWTYAALIIDEILKDFATTNADLAVQLRDVTRPDAAVPLFSMGSSAPGNTSVWTDSFSIQGRQWQIEARPTTAFIKQLHLPPAPMVFTHLAVLTLVLSMLMAAWAHGRRGKRSLVAQRSLLASIVDNSTDAIIVVQLDGKISNWNQQATSLFGYSQTEAVGYLITELVVPVDRHHEEADMLARCGKGLRIQPFDTVRLHRDGSLLQVSVTAIPVSDGSGRVTAVAKVVRDISQQKMAEQTLKDTNARLENEVDAHSDRLQSVQRDLRNIIDAIPSMIGYWDKDQINRFANRAYTQALGIDHAQIPGMHLHDLLGEEYELRQPTIEAALRGTPQSFEASHDIPGIGQRRTMTQFLPDIVDGDVLGFYALTTDITEITASRQQLSDLLRESEALMQTIHQHSLVSIADSRGLIIDANKAFCMVSGYSREELLGQDHRIVNSGLQPPEFWKSMWHMLRRGKTWRGEICNRAKDGSLYWVDSTIAAFHDEHGQVAKYISIRTDITANKHAQRRLAENEAFLERASQVSGIGSFRTDLRTGKQTWSKKAYEIHDLDESSPITSELVDNMLTPAARAQMREMARIAHQTGQGFDAELELTTARGRPIWVQIVGEVEQENGVPVTIIGAIRDITQRRHNEQQLSQVTSLLKSVLDSASEVSIIATDSDLVISVFNAGAERLLGYRSDEFIGRSTPAVFHDADEMRERAAELSLQLGRTITGGAVFTEPTTLRQPREWTYICKDGRRVAVSLVVTPMYAQHGTLIGYLGIAHDITHQQQYEASLRVAMQHAEKANLAKSEFLANMSHEIRTPLNAVIGMGYLLEQTPLSPDQQSMLTKIQFASRALLGVINNVLDLSKIEAGEMTLEEVPCNLLELELEIGAMLRQQAQKKGIELRVVPQANLPTQLLCDATRLRQMLINLLNNAIKFTDTGQVTLHTSVIERKENVVRIRFAVRDTGIGIAPDVIGKLFTPFAQADTSTTRRFGGTGLGLSITRRFVELMGGKIGVNSEFGTGSEFWMELPLPIVGNASLHASTHLNMRVATATDDAPQELYPLTAMHGDVARTQWLPGVQVLVADDSEVNLEVARRILEKQGAIVTTCADGAAAVAQLRVCACIDLVLMDIQMPVMDGNEAARCIRSELQLTLPIIALTAGALVSERQRSLECGMNDFLTKPFEPQALIRMVRRHVEWVRDTPPMILNHSTSGNQPQAVISSIDSNAVQRTFGADHALFIQLLARVLSDNAEFALPMAVDAGDTARQALRSKMHKLKGSAGLIGAMIVHRLAGAAERALEQNESVESIEVIMAQLATALTTLREQATTQLNISSASILDEPAAEYQAAKGVQ